MMKASFTETFFTNDGKEIKGEAKSIILPFTRVSARAIVIRRKDGAILATLHRKSGSYALPGGGVDDGESPEDALIRELDEENIELINSDEDWRERISVNYFDGYKELTLWYLFIVDEANIKPCDENIETKWVSQDDDIWYPLMREKILLAINIYQPVFAKKNLVLNDK